MSWCCGQGEEGWCGGRVCGRDDWGGGLGAGIGEGEGGWWWMDGWMDEGRGLGWRGLRLWNWPWVGCVDCGGERVRLACVHCVLVQVCLYLRELYTLGFGWND